ncbi:hypothetical protein [Limnoglobus roseus]|uniref:hypothetical protein n=1 Tax=Limnoglobus roseus TaxID=2598579 RepID=UPI0011EB366F|nr:hypothetical protein [Limnoglobus roseus]
MGKDKKGRSPKEEVATFTLRIPRPMMEALELYCKQQEFPPSKQTVIEKLLTQFLQSKGVYPGLYDNVKD